MNFDKTRRYAIYGGSFDPVHTGHLAVAESAVRECGLEKLIFMPAYISPFKQDRKVTPGEHRCGMLRAVLKYNPAFRLSTYELQRKGPSYTIETLRHWDSMLSGRLSFILGFDSVIQVDTWYMGEEILRNYPLITARRPDTEDQEGLEKIECFRKKYGADITVLEMPPVDASSTEIRARVSRGEPVAGLVPPEVEEYILEHKLYRQR